MAEKELVSHSVTYQTANENDEGQRLDNYLARNLKGVPRSMIYRILRRGEVRVNKGRVSPSYKLKEGDVIRIPPVTVTEGPVTIPSSNLHLVQDLRNRILFENEDLLVVDKPAGLAVQGGKGITHSLDIDFAKEVGKKVYLVHRLDKETCGLMIVAKNPLAAKKWTKLISSKQVKKEYFAICAGHLSQKKGSITEDLEQHGKEKSAVTYYQVDKEWTVDYADGETSTETINMTNIRLQLETGRMHQIRIHLSKQNCPIAGDDIHGNFKLNKNYGSKKNRKGKANVS